MQTSMLIPTVPTHSSGFFWLPHWSWIYDHKNPFLQQAISMPFVPCSTEEGTSTEEQSTKSTEEVKKNEKVRISKLKEENDELEKKLKHLEKLINNTSNVQTKPNLS